MKRVPQTGEDPVNRRRIPGPEETDSPGEPGGTFYTAGRIGIRVPRDTTPSGDQRDDRSPTLGSESPAPPTGRR